jgi:hypothetical protein
MVGALTAPTSMALRCRWRSRPQHQMRTLGDRTAWLGMLDSKLRNVGANYPFERSHRFAGIQPNSAHRDYSRLSCGVSAECQMLARASGESLRWQELPKSDLPRLSQLAARSAARPRSGSAANPEWGPGGRSKKFKTVVPIARRRSNFAKYVVSGENFNAFKEL